MSHLSIPALVLVSDNRLFHLDLPSPAPGQVLAPRSAAEQARAQHIRDCTSHGRGQSAVAVSSERGGHGSKPRFVHSPPALPLSSLCADYDPISHARMNVLPPSAESQLADKLCGRNAVARYAQDQRNAAASLAAEA